MSNAGYVDENGIKHYYTSALSDDATFTLEYLRMIHAARIAGSNGAQGSSTEECALCWDLQNAEPFLKARDHFTIVADFFGAFRAQFKRPFNETPRSFWRPRYQRGIAELRDLGLVEGLEKDATGTFIPRRVWFSRVHPGTVELKEG